MALHQEVVLAERRIRRHIRETPVEHSLPLSVETGAEVYLKLENFQVTGSFKARGALNKLFDTRYKTVTVKRIICKFVCVVARKH